MPRTYYNQWNTNSQLRRAVQHVVNGDSFHNAYLKTGIWPASIKRYYLMSHAHPNKFKYDSKEEFAIKYKKEMAVFTTEQEAELMKCFKHFGNLFYGLSKKECRMLAYQKVISEDMKIPEGWKQGMASLTWEIYFHIKYSSFMNELEKPDRICTRYQSMRSRVSDQNIVWEKTTVTTFYNKLETYMQKSPEIKDNMRIYSLDEAFLCVHPERNIVDRESMKSDLLTTCCFICADGTTLPPVVIKPNLPYSEIPSGEVTFTVSRGRMTPDLFTEVMHHFVKHSRSSLSYPTILIMDTDLCHLSYDAIALAQESGVYVLTLHPHVSKLLQPLHGELFESFLKSYHDAMKERWIEETQCDYGKLVSEAYSKAMTPEMIQKGFKRCGVSPFDRDLFTDADYLSCLREHKCIECKARYHWIKKAACKETAVNGEVKRSGSLGKSQVEKSEEPDDGGESSQKIIDRNQKAESKPSSDSAGMAQPRSKNGEELDRLKRRLIRSVARLIKEKKSEPEVWDELKKECGKNCKTLWMRMRSLTLKKLKRLFEADDRSDLVPAVARMNLTDWLLYDLVLVHEKIDVINRSSSGESKVLNNLFSLVQRFQIEGRSGDDLAEAWTAATVSYNSKGFQCSPMLMQRRWYQMKELTRHKLYQFWFSYRGNERLLVTAKQDSPTPLQRAISLRYPDIITRNFPGWEERVGQQLVIMPEEFEVKMRKKDLMKPSDEAIPDVLIVEEKVDTITLDSDSDFEDKNDGDSTFLDPDTNYDETSQTPVIVQVKTEPADPDDNIDITEHSIYPETLKDRYQDAIEKLKIEEENIAMCHLTASETSQVEDYVMPLITNVAGGIDEALIIQETTVANNVEVEVRNPTELINDELEQTTRDDTIVNNEESESVSNTFDDNSQASIVIDDDYDDIRSTKNAAQSRSTYNEEPTENDSVGPIITTIASGSPVKAKMEMITDVEYKENLHVTSEVFEDSEDFDEDIITVGPAKESNMELSNEVMLEPNFADDGFDFADDGIEYNDDYNEQSSLNEPPQMVQNTMTTDENAGKTKFDLKLLMNAIVYTTKLDNMKVYKGRSLFEPIDEKHLVDKIFLESKPVRAQSMNVEQIKADHYEIKKANEIVQFENSHEFEDDLFHNESSNEPDSYNEMLSCDDSMKVGLSSSLLQKPRSRSYNPIQLCKNPDFNTRLKRLPISFFSSERNRVFLKACKPMTIDLSKAFESKLVNGTIYLKPSDPVIKEEREEAEDVSESAASIIPSAVAVQSLMDTTDIDKILQEELRKRLLERNKTVNLPNLSVVRQINQNLQMAEVAPIISQVENSTREVIDVFTHTRAVEKGNSKVTEAIEVSNQILANSVKQTGEISNQNSTNLNIQNAPATNSDRSKRETDINMTNPLLPMMNNDKSKEDKTVEKLKKKYTKSNMHRPLWSSKITNNDRKSYSESLLTIDTLYKVLNALDPTRFSYTPKTKPSKAISSKKGRPLGSSNKKTTNPNNETEKPETNLLTANPPTENPLTENPPAVNPSTENPPTNNLRKRTKKKKSCCWARTRINNTIGLSNVRERKHKCPVTTCRCCCREILRQTEINREIKILEELQNRDRFDETIEEVVQQSRDSTSATIEPLTLVRHPKKQIQKPLRLSYMANACLTLQSEPKRPAINVDVQAVDDDDTNGNDHDAVLNNSPKYDAEPQKNIDTVLSVPEKISKNNNNNMGQHSQQGSRSHARQGVYCGDQITDKHKSESEVTIDLDDYDEIPRPKLRVYSAYPRALQIKETPIPKKAPSRISTLPLIVPKFPQPPTVILPSPTLGSSRTKLKTVAGTKITAAVADLTSEDPEDDLELLCSCRPNVGVDKRSSMLVVDGSNECPRHTKSRVSKETRIYLNHKHMSAAARPFYVGRNKILLTNISPRKAQVQPLAPKVPLELPAGVQVVLLPDGTISYLVDIGVELTPEQIKLMPRILVSIQQQINASGITLPLYDAPTQETMAVFSSNEITNNVHSTSDVQNNENNNAIEKLSFMTSDSMPEHRDSFIHDSVQTELQNEATHEPSNEAHNAMEIQTEPQEEVNQEPLVKNSNDIQAVKNVTDGGEQILSIDTFVDKENTPKDITEAESSACSEPASNIDNLTNISEGSEENEQGAESEKTNNTIENKNTVNTAVSRNLLSDLMEMSGILEEDVAPVQQQPTTNNAPEPTQFLTIDVSQDSSIQLDSIAPLSPDAQKHSISAQINEKTYNLNPITSFTELKYACDNHGLFFKLDLNNGLIVPINVCIQKTPESTKVKNATPSEVIDLTDEHSFTIEEPVKNAVNANTGKPKLTKISVTAAKKVIIAEKVKPPYPTMLLQNKRPRGRPPKYAKSILIDNESDQDLLPLKPQVVPPLSSLSMQDRKLELMKRLSNNLKPLKIHQNKRNAINILRKSLPLQSNGSIVRRITKIKRADEDKVTEYCIDDSSDDSDDEPLAKIAKKMRPNETEESTDAKESLEESQSGPVDDDVVDFEDAIDAISAIEPPTILNSLLRNDVEMAEPVPTQLVLSGEALDQPLPNMINNSIDFVENESNDEDSEGDCILGV